MRFLSPSMSRNRKGLFLRIIAITALSTAMFLTFMPVSPAQEPLEPAPFAFTSGDWSVGEVAVGRAPNGDAIAAWNGKKNDTQTYQGLYAQRVDTNGDFLWEGGLTLAEPASNVAAPMISVAADGSAIAVWRDNRTVGSKLYSQKVSPAGNTMWTTNGVAVANTMGEQHNPSLVSDGQGGAIVAWEDYPNGIPNVYAQRIDSSGNHKWGSGGMLVSDAAGGRDQPSVVSDGNGGAVVAWHELNGSDVYGQRFDAAGNRQWGSSGKPFSTASMCQTAPTVVMTPNGDFVTIWNDNRTGDMDIYGQKFNGNGNPVWPKETALARDPNVMFDEPKPVRVQGSGWAASKDVSVFFSGTDTTAPASQDRNVYGQVLDTSSGNTALKAPVQVLTPGADDIKGISTAPFSSGGGFVAWSDYHTGQWRSYYNWMDGSGRLHWGEPQSTGVPSNTESQWGEGIASGGQSSALVTWVNYEQGSSKGQAYGSWIGDLFPNTYYFAEGTTRPGFAPFIPIMNKSITDDVAVTCNFLKGDGTTQQVDMTVPANSRGTLNVQNVLGTGDDLAHDFSTIVNSTGPILAERPMYFDYQGIQGGSDVIGATQPGTTFYFAEGTTRPGFTSYFAVANTSSTTSANVTAHFYRGDGTTQDVPMEVPPNTRSTLRVNDVLGEGNDPAYDFGAKVESTNGVPILVERPMYFDYLGQWDGGTDVIGASSPGTTFYFAEGTTRPGFHSYFALANYESQDATAKLTYYRGNGAAETQDITIPASSRQTINVNNILGEGNDPAYDFGAKVESTNGVPFLVERPMYFSYQGQWDGGTDVIGAPSLDTTFYFAEGTTRPGFDTYFSLSNIGGSDTASVDIEFHKGDGTTQTHSVDVPPNSRTTVRTNDILGEGQDIAHDFSATVRSTNGVPILVERPMYFSYQGQWDGGTDVIGFTP
jgi:hypothetical protein